MCQKNNLTSSLMGHNSSLTEKCQNAWNAPGNSYDPQRKGVTRRTLLRPTRLLEYELKNILSQQLAPLLNSSVMPAN